MNLLFAPIHWVLDHSHDCLVQLGMHPTSELGWALSIVMLVLLARLAMLGPALRQARTGLKALALAPHVEALRRKHRTDPGAYLTAVRRLNLANDHKPAQAFLLMLVQAPLLLGLTHVLRHDFAGAPLGLSVRASGAWLATGLIVATSVICLALTQILVQRNMLAAKTRLEGQFRRLQLWLAPTMVVMSSSFMPLGVLVYLATTNLFTTLQQLLINKIHPVSRVATMQVQT